ncbi:uncharacterized protein LOC144927586 [Branchiostoma floridae x Branchiostoma belcheri]
MWLDVQCWKGGTTFFLVLSLLVRCSTALSGPNVCSRQTSWGCTEGYSQRYYTSCGIWGGSTCTRYRYAVRDTTCYGADYFCCPGYTASGGGCIPVCHGITTCPNGGNCASPDYCANCNDGYYSPRCDQCTHIPNCVDTRCTTNSDQRCHRCSGEYGSSGKAYDNLGTSCREKCSWRTSSNNCYPGTCPTTPSTCTCATGFGGAHCRTITAASEIIYCLAALTKNHDRVDTNCLDNSVKYTNMRPTSLTLTWRGHFTPSVPARPGYVHNHGLGLIAAGYSVKQVTNGNVRSNDRGTCSSAASRDNPIQMNCEENMHISTTFSHGDKLQIQGDFTNGGYINIINRDASNRLEKSYYSGVSTSSNTAEFVFDYVAPTCTGTQLNIGDSVSKQNQITLQFSGWTDALSGVTKYEYSVYMLVAVGETLTEPHTTVAHGTIQASSIQHPTITLTHAGVYSVILTVDDVATNYRRTRRFVLFDNANTVELDSHYPLAIANTVAGNGDNWLHCTDCTVTATWTGHFINRYHHQNKLLNPIANFQAGIDADYDQTTGTRNKNAIPNALGVTQFKVAYTKDHAGGSTMTTAPSSGWSAGDLNTQFSSTASKVDGDTVKLWVKASDIMGNEITDSITAHIDSSAPVIENMWLASGDETNIVVHNSVELYEMQVQFDAFDQHSGLHDITWTLADFKTSAQIASGVVAVQQLTCGATCTTNCVQTAKGPCYKKDYVITFDRSQVDVGGHDHDYLVTLTVRNKATLSTTQTLKITVDTSPPLPGTVHDGLEGQAEIDYQQTTAIKTWWDGFFDEESGVKFYLYGYSTSCLDADDLQLPKGASITRTTDTNAVYTAPSPGTYFCTVVAYNHALDPSAPVCSDGVTVDVTPPTLTAIHVDHLAVRPGVVKDAGGDVWLIDQRRHRVLVLDPPAQCLTVPQVNNIDDYAPRRDLVTNTTLTNQYCTRHSGAPTTNYVSMDRNLFVSWIGEDESGIYDFSVGLSSTSSTSSPDIMPFTSTTGIPELRFSHPRLSQNSQFHLVIKAENSAGLTTVKAVGPTIVDITPPQFTGQITLSKEGNFLVGRWTGSDFFDDESQDPLMYSFAVGRHPSLADVLRFRHVGANGPCVSAQPPNCAAIGTDVLHPSDSLYMFVKVTNPASLSVIGTSSAYSIPRTLPANGVVFDIKPDVDDPGSHDYEDVDAQTDTGALSARWFGFSEDPAAVTYEVAVGTTAGGQDVQAFTAAAGTDVSITGLSLQYFQTYFITVKATNNAGSVTISSDGVTVLEHDGPVQGMMVKDGPGCFENSNVTCQDNAEYQRSTTTMWVRWNTPSNITSFIREFYWTIEQEIRDASDSLAYTSLGCWKDAGDPAITPLEGLDERLDGDFRFRENAIAKCYNVARDRGASVFALRSGGECYGSADGHSTYNKYGPSTICEEDGKGGPWANEVYQITAWYRRTEPLSVKGGAAIQSNLNLRPGNRYRSIITPCYKTGCFEPVVSSGTWITPNAPVSGRLSVAVTETSGEGPSTLTFSWDAFEDGDVPKSVSDGYVWTPVSTPAIDRYEWAVTSDTERKELLLPWTQIDISNNDVERHQHSASVPRHILATGCPKLVVRAINKVGLQSSVETDINDCSRNTIGRQHLVIDATGTVQLEKNALWYQDDADYTSSQSTLSAVWPSLRQGQYTWAVIEESASNSDYGSVSGSSQFPYPCAHPLAISCGNTTDEYVNVDNLALQQGRRYHICIHANKTLQEYETFSQWLPAVSACSDGITVDRTPPTPGRVWIENSDDKSYQSSSSEIVVRWTSFVDLEEHGVSRHVSGIRTYLCAIGTSPEGIDVQDFTEVGNINSVVIHNLGLNSGITYYATIKGVDFVGLSAIAVSNGILVDTTPPEKNDKGIDIGGLFLQSLDSISVSWPDVFVDKESGVTSFYWAVGSAPRLDDAVRLQPAKDDMADSAVDPPLLEGHTYYITIMAENGAGLVSTAISHGYVAETSPPEAGFVHDGPAADPPNDLDYQTDKTTISAHWGGFHDPHTDIVSYKWSIGTCPMCKDVLEDVDLGIKSDMSASNLPLVPGFTYYVTITACNAAQLCTTTSSDGVLMDDTPPVAGTVRDGAADVDVQYQPSTYLLRASWFGFHDAHSQLSHYEWRAGTSSGGSDILPASTLHLSETAVVTLTTPMPADTTIYVTVKAFNKAGLSVERSSDGFLIDATAPTVTTRTAIDLSWGSLKADTQVIRSLLRVSWQFADPDSGIEYHLLSVTTHQESRHDLPTIKVSGNDQSYTFSNMTLHDGNRYSVTVVACNRAKLCTESTSTEIMVDGSPPKVGTFAVGTDHAIDNQRPQSGWMTWQNNVNGNPTLLRLAWLGFTDVHSGIDKYLVFVGTNFDADNLIPSGPIEVAPSDSSLTTLEGVVHTAEIPVATALSGDSTVYIKIVAVNEVGMRAPASHEAFSLVSSAADRGFLSLVRRCQAHTCLGHCICASQDKLCTPTASCSTATGVPTTIDLIDTMDFSDFSSVSGADDIAHTPAADFLAAAWTPSSQVTRYEWSAGIKDEAVGSGVFNLLTDKIWHGTDGVNYAILNLPVTKDGARTVRGAEYVIYVRAWYSETTYKIYSTNGVEMDFSPPSVHRSTKVKDLMTTSATDDIDYRTDATELVCGWDGVFYDTGSGIDSFELAVGIGPNDESVSPYASNKLSGATTTHQLTGLTLTEGTRYHCNIRAYNKVQLYSTASSDGVIVDTIVPTAGVVMDGVVLHDVEYTNVSTSIAASWHGFWDAESFLHHYMWCVGTTAAPNECSVLTATDVGLRTAARTQLETALDSGVKYYSKVYAVDAAGLQSAVAKSDGMTIDTTAPVLMEKLEVGQNIVQDFSFEESSSQLGVESGDALDFSSLPSFTSSHWTVEEGSTAAVLNASAGDHGINFLYLAGSISQLLSTTSGSKYRMTLSLKHNPFVKNKRSDEEVLIEAPGVSKIVQLYHRPGRHDAQSENRWQKATMFFTATSGSSAISIATPGRTRGVLIDNVDVRLCNVMEVGEGMSSNNSVHVELEIIHGFNSVFASWGFVDMESPIVDYMWAIGTVQGGTQLQTFRSAGTSDQGVNSNLTLTQGSYVHVTVVAVNAAGLRSVVHSEPALVDKTPPVISFVKDGSTGMDVDYQSDNVISARWDATDPESGISRIEWAIGLEPGSASISDYTVVEASGSASKSVSSLVHGQTVFVTVRCHNNVGLHSTMSSDGVTIVTDPPSTAAAQLSVVTRSETQYPTRGNHQSQTDTLLLSWGGFMDTTGILAYQYALEGPGVDNSAWYNLSPYGDTSTLLGLDLQPDSSYKVFLRAINNVQMESASLQADVQITSTTPSLSGEANVTHAWDSSNTTVMIDWEGVFDAETDLVYEITIGTTLGGNDVQQWVETVETSITVSQLDATKHYFGTITAINQVGMYENVLFDFYR